MDTKVVIIGGGLSGLVTAWELSKRGIEFRLIEARDRYGGRILSAPLADDAIDGASAVDLGPAWFWPGQQHMTRLIEELELATAVFLQPSAGDSVMEYRSGKIERGQGSASMTDSYRLEGGLQRLTAGLLDRISPASCMSNSVASRLLQTSSGVRTTLMVNGLTQTIDSEYVVLALPPRLVVQSLVFTPALPDSTQNRLNSVATWMAGQAKFVAVYESAFWRDNGMSGDAFSHLGPLVEIHDASPVNGGPYALFGFVGVPALHRAGRSVELKQAAVEQLVRMFGETADKPTDVYFQDWAFEPFTATEADRMPQGSHSSGTATPSTEWDGRIVWAGTEFADEQGHSNGYLEGAVESGLRAARILGSS